MFRLFILKMSAVEETFVGAIDEGTSSTRFLVCTNYNNTILLVFFKTYETNISIAQFNIY